MLCFCWILQTSSGTPYLRHEHTQKCYLSRISHMRAKFKWLLVHSLMTKSDIASNCNIIRSYLAKANYYYITIYTTAPAFNAYMISLRHSISQYVHSAARQLSTWHRKQKINYSAVFFDTQPSTVMSLIHRI